MRLKSISGLIAMMATALFYLHPTAQATQTSQLALKAYKKYQQLNHNPSKHHKIKVEKLEQFLKKIS